MNQDNNWLKIQILRKYLHGFSQEQIATELDISEGAVSEFLQQSRQQDDTLIFQHEIAVI
jgi:DNA-directed RNA polymerase specialized sigma24 family protein